MNPMTLTVPTASATHSLRSLCSLRFIHCRIGGWITLLLLLAFSAPAQTQTPARETLAAEVLEQSGDSTRWRATIQTTDSSGRARVQSGEYTALKTGGNWYDFAQRRWRATVEEFEITSEGYAVAGQGQHRVSVSPALNDVNGAVRLATPHGQEIRATILGLALYSRASGASLLVGEITNSAIGQLVALNTVLFTNCFTGPGPRADIRLVYEAAGFHQDVVFRESFDPQWLRAAGFDPDSEDLHLEVWTRFFVDEEPRIKSRVIRAERDTARRAAMVEPDIIEEELFFAGMKMPIGRAYVQGAENDLLRPVRVTKRWLRQGTERYLVESVPLKSLDRLLAHLPAQGNRGGANAGAANENGRRAPAPLLEPRKDQRIVLAQAAPIEPGVIVDYFILNHNTNALVLNAGETYYVEGPVYADQIVLQGATVKFKPGVDASLSTELLDCQTSATMPAVFTARDDDDYGAVISGSSGSPSGPYATVALEVTDTAPIRVEHLRIFHSTDGLRFLKSQEWHIRMNDVQIRHCNTAVHAESQEGDCGECGLIEFQNGLIADCGMAFSGYFWHGIMENITVSDTGALVSDDGLNDNPVYFTNSVFVNVSETGCEWCGTDLQGAYNGFYNSPPFGSATVTNTTIPFDPFGGFDFYLDSGCNFIDAGDRTAAAAGLYHFTTLADHTKEGSSTVDLGYHVLALDDGLPVDTDGDGIPDYIEDANGNGAVDGEETSWSSATDLGLRVRITEPKSSSNLP
jgi:hypothetical protein